MANDPDFDFLSKMSEDDPESPYITNEFSCEYLSSIEYSNLYRSNPQATIMSINVQSITAKFNDLSEFIISLINNNAHPDVLCLQELWQLPPDVNLILPDYNQILYKTRSNNVQGGGVGIYVKKGIKYSISSAHSIFVDRIFESLFIDIIFPNKFKCTIGSVYRPTNHPQLTQTAAFESFTEILTNLLSSLTNSNTNFYITGDFNLDAINYGLNSRVNDYMDLLFSFGVLQTITLPTRCTHNSATLIDHILTNVNQLCYKSVVMTNRISDHFPIVFFLETSK
jgi:hypothetical protein